MIPKDKREQEAEEERMAMYWQGWDAGFQKAIKLLREHFLKRMREDK